MIRPATIRRLLHFLNIKKLGFEKAQKLFSYFE